MTRPAHLGILQRIEYMYRDKDQLVAPKLDGPKKFGTYGMIEVTVIFYYPSIPGKLYHPIDNSEEATWWLDFYRMQTEIVTAFFVPAPDGEETGIFSVPDMGTSPDPDPPVDWYSPMYEADAYTK